MEEREREREREMGKIWEWVGEVKMEKERKGKVPFSLPVHRIFSPFPSFS